MLYLKEDLFLIMLYLDLFPIGTNQFLMMRAIGYSVLMVSGK